MALRTSKITSEIIHSCNKFFSSSAETTLKSKIPANLSNEAERAGPPFRYKITNTEKPQCLPELNFKNEEGTSLFAELQPCAKPEFRFDFNPPKWAEKPSDNSPFPQSIKLKSRLHVTYTDMQKAEDKFVRSKLPTFTPPTRNFSTVCRRNYCHRGPADNSGAAHCKKKLNRCVKLKRKECKITNKACPKLKLEDCKPSKGSHCNLYYLDPHCTKKFAPYPSYSESCAEQLPEDPSECQQCPWRTCDGADSIEPGKPVRHKRHYSTSCHRHLDATGGVVIGPLLPTPLTEVEHSMCGKCGVTKTPCKQPPGPCEKRKHREEHKHMEKNKHHHHHHEGSKKKKASDMNDSLVLSKSSGQNMQLNPFTLEPVNFSINLNNPNPLANGSWIDLVEGPGSFSCDHKRKPPNCQKHKKPKRPKKGDVDEEMAIEYGEVDWWSGRGKKTVVTEPLDPDKKNCPIEKCRKQTIRSKQYALPIKPEALLCKHKKIKGDEGHPPPCEYVRDKSKRCPTEPLRKPKFKKRPLQDSYYKRPEEPYNKND